MALLFQLDGKPISNPNQQQKQQRQQQVEELHQHHQQQEQQQHLEEEKEEQEEVVNQQQQLELKTNQAQQYDQAVNKEELLLHQDQVVNQQELLQQQDQEQTIKQLQQLELKTNQELEKEKPKQDEEIQPKQQEQELQQKQQEQQKQEEQQKQQEQQKQKEQHKQEEEDEQLQGDKKVEVYDIREALYLRYGGQAVGNGYRFLVFYHLLPFYLISNIIIGCNYQNNPEKWGRLNPDESYYCFYYQLMNDCDFLTFVPSLRKNLEKEIFMKDLEKTDELLKRVFDHIYLYVLMGKRLMSFDETSFKFEVEEAIHTCFKLQFDSLRR
jgi:hypothetical protein